MYILLISVFKHKKIFTLSLFSNSYVKDTCAQRACKKNVFKNNYTNKVDRWRKI